MTHYTPEQLAKLAKIPNIERRLAEERAARGRSRNAQQRTFDAMKALEGVLVRARGAALPELRTAAWEASARHLEPMNRFFEQEGVRYIRLLGIPGVKEEKPKAYGVALALQQLLDEWSGAVNHLAVVAEDAARAHADHQQVAAPLEAEVERVLGHGLH